MSMGHQLRNGADPYDALQFDDRKVKMEPDLISPETTPYTLQNISLSKDRQLCNRIRNFEATDYTNKN
ncbi:jg21939 [Pararge aegeria aegeria]|uniref:Jg21939 protein n=1 Tax=Pararge aegeria aegeria TaxID=348720 RepID=A0A8S4SKP4_9NEOP|nr:jg21939 [Pararge aegeria aegeria]